jgi:hypothetical protein
VKSAAKDWRNTVPCMCSVTVTEKHGAVLDKSACPRHGKAAKT